MTGHAASPADLALKERFEAATLPPAEFSHEAHVRLAYAYLASGTVEAAVARLRTGLQAYIAAQGIDPAKYHETLTQAWILAVAHFMQRTADCASAGEFVARNPVLLDSRAMMTHYSKERLFSPEARERFVEPDLDPIPKEKP